MHEMPWVIASGFVFGILFYGGLWWTVNHASDFRRPFLVILGSGLLRIGSVLVGFYLVAGGEWSRILQCLLGFLIARLAATWATRLPLLSASGETRNAP